MRPSPGQKVRAVDGSVDEMLEDADAALDELKANYTTWALEDIGRMQACLDAAVAEPAAAESHLEDLFKVCHDVKGQGGSFDYPLVTAVGQSLCDFLRTGAANTGFGHKVIAAHLGALRPVLENGISGDAGATGARLVEELAALVARDA